MQVELSGREVELVTDALSELHELLVVSLERPANGFQREKFEVELEEVNELFDKINGLNK